MTNALIDIDNLNKAQVKALLEKAQKFRTGESTSDLSGKVVGLIFFQASTRTRLGFHAAIGKMNGTAILKEGVKLDVGQIDAESIEDSLKVISDYCDLIVIRHRDPNVVVHAQDYINTPIVNAGNGTDHHPTQSLIDLFTIQTLFQKIEGLKVGVVGDINNGRAGKSFLKALNFFPPSELRLMYPASRGDVTEIVENCSYDVELIADDLNLVDLDVVYVSGFPPSLDGTVPGKEERERLALTEKVIKKSETKAKILCPLPRLDEIAKDTDTMPNAYYFQQSALGLYMRMAIVDHFIKR